MCIQNPLWLAALALISVLASAQGEPRFVVGSDRPVVDFVRADYLDLVSARVKAERGDPAAREQARERIKRADQALGAEIVTVMDKTQVAASGDKHDYLSLAPYFWPDPGKPNGLPWIRRDGEVNPLTRGRNVDYPASSAMFDRVEELALGYFYSQKAEYRDRALAWLEAWFIDPATRMNPNLDYAQGIPGVNNGRCFGIIEWKGASSVIQAVQLLEAEQAIPSAVSRGVREWFGAYADWLQHSELGIEESTRGNNHGSWYDVQLVRLLLFLDRVDAARAVLEAVPERRIAVQIEPDGSQPRELDRTKSLSYSSMNLRALTELAEFGQRLGVDIWGYRSPDGRSLPKAYAFFEPYLSGEKEWPYPQIGDKKKLLDSLRGQIKQAKEMFENSTPEAVGEPGWLNHVERPRILGKAALYLEERPVTVTAARAERSAGGPHDFYSEGDYWWPDPDNPSGPYIRRDGETYPELFVAHREAMVRLSDIVATLTSAYLLTGDDLFAAKAVEHLKAWFVDEATLMNPSLLYGQAISGRSTGRSIGIIDTIHLVEVARGAKVLSGSKAFSPSDEAAVKDWFRSYLTWINEHPYGQAEKVHPNNHGVCWSLQASAFADLLGDEAQLDWARNQFKTVYLAEMMDERGGFPAELARTKPYGYSLFVIDAMAGLAQLLTTPEEDLWSFELPDGRGMALGLSFIYPYIQDKDTWSLPQDVLFWDQWPVRHPSLVFGGYALSRPDYLRTWESLEADPTVFEVLRNLPLRHPLLWVDAR